MVSSAAQASPRDPGASQIVTGCPPDSDTFLSFPPAKNPIHLPSGE